MFDVQVYFAELEARLKEIFGARLAYIGLQGSYLRGEATETSDIDAMVLIEDLAPEDLDAYRRIILKMERPELSCGFLCSAGEMRRWNRLEACQLSHTTKDIYGTLSDFLPEWTMEDERQYVALSLGNLYHELAHRYVHGGPEKSRQKLPATAKQLFFILQNLHFVESGVFCETKAQLLEELRGEDKEVLSLALSLKDGSDPDAAFARIFVWCAGALHRV